jgi:hypothetical protein
MPVSNRPRRLGRRLGDVLRLRDSRTDEVMAVALGRPGALRVHVCGADLRDLLVADLVRRVATLSHDLAVRMTATGMHADAGELNIHPADIVEGDPGADVRIGCADGTSPGGLLLATGATTIDGRAHDPLAVRLALLEVEYGKPADLDGANVAAAQATLSRWRGLVAQWARSPGAPMAIDAARAVSAAFDDDLDTPLALLGLLALETAESVAPGAKFETFAFADRFFGLDLARDIR